MHREPKHFVACVKRQYPDYFTNKKVLEVGSLDINGSVREFFTDCVYTGIDLGEGKGVDRVAHVTESILEHSLYDVVISTETLEHDAKWKLSLEVMFRLLKPNGLLVITCAAPNRPEHGTTRTGSADASPFTSDYYRNISVEDFASVLPANLFSKSYLGYRGNMDDLYFAGIKASITVTAIGVTDEFRGAKFARVDSSRPPVFDDIDAADENRAFYVRSNNVDANPTSLTELVDKFGSIQLPTITEPFTVPRNLTITAEISTKDRYTTTLQMAIASILMQTRKPEKLVIYDDGEQKDLRELPPFDGLLRLATDLGVEWTFFSTERKGQVANHQHALENCSTDLIFRCDDDVILEPDCLENLLAEMKQGVGAVGGLIHHPGGVSPLPDFINGSLDDVAKGLNIAWYDWSGEPREVAHLYSSFLMRVSSARKAGGYCMNLSPAGHHEETLLTNSINRAGFKVICTPRSKMYHLRQNTGGIRSYSDGSLWQHDEVIFQEYLKTIGHVKSDTKVIVIDCGIGDHYAFRSILPQIREIYKDKEIVLAVCYPEVFKDEGLKMISIAEARTILGSEYDKTSIYQWAWNRNRETPLAETMLAMHAQQ